MADTRIGDDARLALAAESQTADAIRRSFC